MSNVFKAATGLSNEERERILRLREERRQRKWARDNYRLYQPIDPSWNPIIQDECRRINKELDGNAMEED